MNYQFIGRHFMFEKDCPTIQDVENVVKKCSREVDIRGFKIKRKITEIWRLDDGVRILPAR